MQSFRDLQRHFDRRLPLDVIQQLEAVGEGKGRETGHATQRPQKLAMLRALAVIQSIDTSNALEGITAPPDRIAALVEEKTTPANRSEQEIAGYRYALGQIHDHGADIPFEPRYVLQLHGYVFRFSGVPHGGTFKRLPNTVSEKHVDGTVAERFSPLSPERTPAAMSELHQCFAEQTERGTVPYLLLCSAYVLDFLTIHPFTDGNGRLSRLLTLLMLYRGGYGVGRYISLERIVLESGSDYYLALKASTLGWHENQHDLLPWTRYFLGILVAAYREFDGRMDAVGDSGADKRHAVHVAIDEWPRDEFSAAEIARAVPSISRDYLRTLLGALRDRGILESIGRGRSARWRRCPGWREQLWR